MRKLKENEIDILKTLILSNDTARKNLIDSLEGINVEDMDDGEMGSLKFSARDNDERAVGDLVAESEFVDSDGTTVSMCLNLDNHGDLFELDIWKTDFSKLRSWPSPDQLQIKK